MSRYIDADAVKINYIGGFKDTFEIDYDSFMNAPSIDIVRCKECRYYLQGECIALHTMTKADDYCSYGVRKTNTIAEEKPTPIRDYMVYGEREGE